jgi:uncharacterized membrane protein (DUF106 family)
MRVRNVKERMSKESKLVLQVSYKNIVYIILHILYIFYYFYYFYIIFYRPLLGIVYVLVGGTLFKRTAFLGTSSPFIVSTNSLKIFSALPIP